MIASYAYRGAIMDAPGMEDERKLKAARTHNHPQIGTGL